MAGRGDTPFGLSEAEVVRYARHLILPEVGGAGQRRLLDAVARVDGAGAAREEAALFLTAAGVGTVLVDDPAVASRVRALNPNVRLATVDTSPSEPWRCEVRGERRLDGALAALRLLMAMLGRVPAEGWRGLEVFEKPELGVGGGPSR